MKFLLNLLFPKFCIGCNRIGSYICADCFGTFKYLSPQRCPYCFSPSDNGFTHIHCMSTDGIDGGYSVLNYSGIAKIVIKDIKYRRIYSVLEDFFAGLPKEKMKEITTTIRSYNIDYIQPVPLHRERKKLRGFNQSEKIAQQITHHTNIPLVNIVQRTVNTSPQAQITNKEMRNKNIKGAFTYCGEDFYKGKNILLIDDLYTTGSTSKEIAKELKRNGIANVFCFSLAHG